MAEVDEFTTKFRRAERLVETNIIDDVEHMLDVMEILKDLTDKHGSVRRNKIEDQIDGETYQSLQFLKQHGYAASSGQGGNWKYTGPN